MDYGTFSHHVKKIYDYFDRKHPDPEKIKLWHRRAQNIPADAIPAIQDYFFDLDSLPRNVGKTFLAGWNAWKQSNPSKVAQPVKTPCSECRGEGVLIARQYHKDMKNMYSYAFRCGKCTNWAGILGESIPMATRDQLRRFGYTT